LKELLLRILTGISLIVLVAGSILFGPVSFLVMVMVVYGLGMRELYYVYSLEKIIPFSLVAISGGLLIPLTYLGLQYHLSPLWFILPAVTWSIGYLLSGSPDTGTLTLFWLALPLTSFFALAWFKSSGTYRPMFPLLVLSLVWINDTFAYVAGNLIGKHKLTPHLSPGKTWEGFIGGLGFTLLGGWVVYRVTGEFASGTWIFLSLIIGVFGLMGDLFESRLKRRINVKDTGTLLPGHGGILDRFDSLLFAAPMVMLILIIISFNK